MKSLLAICSAAVVLASSAATLAPSPAGADSGSALPESPVDSGDSFVEDDLPVFELDLSGPRFGATVGPNGSAVSQFGWHTEHTASSARRGPWLVVETVLLVGGLEQSLIVPSASLVFGFRAPNGLELGVGPSVTIGGSEPVQSGVVIAAGYSFRLGGIRVPLSIACVPRRDGDYRLSVVTGWAIRDRSRDL